MNKVAFFDFCETIADFQTADAYVKFVRERYGNARMRRIEDFQRYLRKTKLIRILQRFWGKEGNVNKRLTAYQLKGFSEKKLDFYAHEYYEQIIKPHFIKDIIEILINLKKQGYKVGVVSGGYGLYLRYFVEDFKLDFLLSSNIAFKNGICTGGWDGPDCLNENKVIYLKQMFPLPPSESIAFSDSQTDVPLLKYARQGVVVSRNRHQNWIDNYNFKEIIWTENH